MNTYQIGWTDRAAYLLSRAGLDDFDADEAAELIFCQQHVIGSFRVPLGPVSAVNAYLDSRARGEVA